MRNFERLCKDYKNIENYEKAKADNFKNWHCHHRLETHNSDGKRRAVDITVAELKALDMYYNRPADELIFLTISEHSRLHMKGKHRSEETKNKMREALKGRQFSEETRKKMREALKGRHHSEETKNKMREKAKGRLHTEETKKKIGEANKGNTATKDMHWYNNGKINIMAYECQDGFVPGRISWKK